MAAAKRCCNATGSAAGKAAGTATGTAAGTEAGRAAGSAAGNEASPAGGGPLPAAAARRVTSSVALAIWRARVGSSGSISSASTRLAPRAACTFGPGVPQAGRPTCTVPYSHDVRPSRCSFHKKPRSRAGAGAPAAARTGGGQATAELPPELAGSAATAPDTGHAQAAARHGHQASRFRHLSHPSHVGDVGDLGDFGALGALGALGDLGDLGHASPPAGRGAVTRHCPDTRASGRRAVPSATAPVRPCPARANSDPAGT